MFKLSAENVEEFYGKEKGKPFFPGLVELMTSDSAVGMELIVPDAVKKWR